MDFRLDECGQHVLPAKDGSKIGPKVHHSTKLTLHSAGEELGISILNLRTSQELEEG